MSRSELYNGFRHTGNIQHMVIVCQCCEPLFVVMRSFVMAEAGFMGSGDWGNLCQHCGKRCSLSKTLVGSCIAFFGLNCCLAGRSVACKAADISNALINTYSSVPSAVAGMVRNMCIWTVFCGHNWFLARRFWHYSGWPQLPVGGAG